MSEATVTIIVALIGSGLITGIISLISQLIDRKSKKGDKTKELETKLATVEKKTEENKLDLTRLQLLVLMSDYPDDKQEILRVAELYFKDMGGNFYMDSIFCKWMKKNNINKPSWFKGND